MTHPDENSAAVVSASSPASSVGASSIVKAPVKDLLNNVDKNGKVIPLDPKNADYTKLLADLQGNILKGHGRDHTYNVFLHFRSSATKQQRRAGIKALAAQYVTSAERQLRERDEFKRFKISGRLFGNLFLTASGYQALGFADADLKKNLPEAAQTTPVPVAVSFSEGIHAHAVTELNDPPISEWQEEYRTPQHIHAMVLIGDDDPNYLQRQVRELLDMVQPFAEIVVVEPGVALKNENNEGIEHFGYVDGRSQPVYLQTEDASGGHNTVDEDGGTVANWNPFEPLSRVLVPDGFAGGGPKGAYGSFFVFRKLEQDVLRFKMNEKLLADALKLQGEDGERAGAMVVGRFEDGTPLTLSKTDGFVPSKENDFTYKFTNAAGTEVDDSAGKKCPFAAHIRKANPRGDIVRLFVGANEEAERSRRITRRGITFGQRKLHPNALSALEELPTRSIGDDHSESVGLLFMCFQANIAQQFGFMQKGWCNNRDFVQPATGLDPVIGQDNANPKGAQKWLPAYGDDQPASPAVAFDFSGFVHMKGGEYFFAPSLAFFRSL